MKRVPEMYKKIINAVESECEFKSCTECIFFQNGICDEITNLVKKMEDEVTKSKKIMQRK